MALEIFRLIGSVFVDTEAAEKSLKKTDKTAEGFGSKLVSVGKSAGKFALGVAGAAVAAGGAIVALTESTREYRTEQGKLQTAFQTQNFTAEQARKTYTALNGVLGDSGQAVEAANHLAKLATNEKDLATWTDICTGVYATFGDSLPIEGLTEAANETAKTGALTGGLADALNWAGVNEEDFQAKLDKCNSEQERAALITKTMNGLYSESAEKYKELNADVIAANEAQDKLNNAMAKVGGAMEPFVTKGKQLLAEVLDKMLPALDWLGTTALPWVAKATTDVSNSFQKYMPQIKKFTEDTFKRIKELWNNDLKPIFNSIVKLIKDDLAPAFKWVFEHIITPVVDAAFHGIGNLWKKTLKPLLEGMIDFISGIFSGNFSKAWDGVLKSFGAVWEGIKTIVKNPINICIGFINSFIRKLNGVKIPDWVPGVGGTAFSMKEIPLLASGGVLERGQVGLLEGSGAEAVVPLHNNKRWISAVARDMDSALGGNNAQVVALLADIRDLMEAMTDAGSNMSREAMVRALVDTLAKPMDKKLGQIQATKARV
jgi:hypothetical protein